MATLASVAALLTPLLLARLPSVPTEPLADRPPAEARELRQGLPDGESTVIARPVPADRVRVSLSPPYEVADGLTILADTRRIRLAGLEGPGPEAACLDPSNRLWACGLAARAALYNLVRLRRVTCESTGAMPGGALVADCMADDVRIGPALVEQGFARPAAGVDAQSGEMLEARKAGRGLWNGGWRIKP